MDWQEIAQAWYALRMTVGTWIAERWLDLIQSAGIIGSLLLGVAALRAEAKSRQDQTRREITKEHREIWSGILSDPETKDILDQNRDLAARPISVAEKHAVNSLMLHLSGSRNAANAGTYMTPERLTEDIRFFFSHPLPRAAWDELKAYHASEFVAFVEAVLAGEN